MANNTLKTKEDFDRVYRTGKRINGRLITIIARQNVSLNKLGISVGKKYGTAVERNRAKRLIREAYGWVAGKMSGAAEIIVVPRQSAKRAATEEIRADFIEIINRI